MRVCLSEEREVVAISVATGLDRFSVVGRLHRIWSWADTHTTDGNAKGVTHSFLDELVNCPGFAKAMRDACWLEGRDGALTFPKFSHHNGQTAKTRALTGNRVKRLRNDACVTQPLPEKRREEKNEKTGTPSKSATPDPVDFIESLKANPAYAGIDIDRELAKMDAWLQTPKGRGRQKTKGFIVNWLNKIDVPPQPRPVVRKPDPKPADAEPLFP